MSSDKFTVTSFFGDAEHQFCLRDEKGDGWSLVRELERKFDTGIFAIFRALYSGNYTLDMIREAFRLGLIGGGKPASEAERLTKLYVDREPIADQAALALEILGAILVGKGNVPAEGVS